MRGEAFYGVGLWHLPLPPVRGDVSIRQPVQPQKLDVPQGAAHLSTIHLLDPGDTLFGVVALRLT